MAFLQKRVDKTAGFGASLQEIRELRGLSRQEVSFRTRIHESLIRALEEERVEDWKDPVYAERHVLAILKVLEVQPGYFLLKYRELLKEKRFERTVSDSFPKMIRAREFFVASHFFAAVGFFVVLSMAVLYLLWQAHALQRSPRLEVMSPVEGQLLPS